MVRALYHPSRLKALEECEVATAAGSVQAAADEGDALCPVERGLRVRHRGWCRSLNGSESLDLELAANAVCWG